MINNSDIKAAWVNRLKSNPAIVSLVNAVEIREYEWKGTDFRYPNIRVKLGPLTPTARNNNCLVFNSEVSIFVFTEQKSSKEADDIAGVIASQFWGHTFSDSGVKFTAVTLDSVEPAITPEEDTNSWRSAVNFTALVQAA